MTICKSKNFTHAGPLFNLDLGNNQVHLFATSNTELDDYLTFLENA